jgi:20S proteasome subunit alpha 5
VGIKTKEGVVLAVEKRVTSVLMEPKTIEKIMEVDAHVGNCNAIAGNSNVK